MQQWRRKLRGRTRVITLYATSVAAVLAVGAGWVELGLPRVAMLSEVKTVEMQLVGTQQFANDTRKLLLFDRWQYLNAKFEAAVERLRLNPANEDVRELKQNLQQQLWAIDRQLEELK